MLASCAENNIGEDSTKINNPCQICLIDIKCQIKEHYIGNLNATGGSPEKKAAAKVKLSAYRSNLDTLLANFKTLIKLDNNSKLELAYKKCLDKCLDLYPTQITDSLKKDELFKQYDFYRDHAQPYSKGIYGDEPFEKDKVFKMDLEEFLQYMKKDTLSYMANEDGEIELFVNGVRRTIQVDELNGYFKNVKSDYDNYYAYVISKQNDIIKLLFNKSLNSLSDIELFMLGFRVDSYINSHGNNSRFNDEYRDEDFIKLERLL